jgi:hypothetical protein
MRPQVKPQSFGGRDVSGATRCRRHEEPGGPGTADARSWYNAAMHGEAPNDTDPRVEAVLVAGYRAMSVTQKLERVSALTRTVQELALLDIRRRHPGADGREVALRLASRWLDAELMKRAFGWDVQSAGF